MKSTVFTVLALAFSFSTSIAAINRVSTGSCANGRTWINNAEFDNNGNFICHQGMNCDGASYNTCTPPPASPPGGGKITVNVSGGWVTMTGWTGSVRITVHDISGAQVYDFGNVSSGASVSTGTIGASGEYTVITHVPGSLGIVTDADLLTI